MDTAEPVGRRQSYRRSAWRVGLASSRPLYKGHMKDVTIGIKSFYRAPQLAACLHALLELPIPEVIVADDGEIDAEKRAVYRAFNDRLPLRLLELEFDTGLSFGRNQIVRESHTPYVLMLDDDQVVPPNIGALRDILLTDRTLGGVSGYWLDGGRLRCTACNLFETERYVIKDVGFRYRRQTTGDLTYYRFDLIPNSTLFRIECLRQFPWDNYYKIAKEHLDFYLTHKRAKQWSFAVTPDVVIAHYPSTTDLRYIRDFRHNQERMRRSNEHFQRKWRKRGVIESLTLHEAFSLRHYLTHYALAASPEAAGVVSWAGRIFARMTGR